jgi:hypothetical protein
VQAIFPSVFRGKLKRFPAGVDSRRAWCYA